MKRKNSGQNAPPDCPCNQADRALEALQRERVFALVRADTGFDQLRAEYLKARAPASCGFPSNQANP